MRFYTGQHRFYCGMDLHVRTLAICILDGAKSNQVNSKSGCNALEG
jgi:hypothetical protein